jgi:hypothetical protein
MEEHKKLNRASISNKPQIAAKRYEVSFRDLSLTVGEKNILQGVSGRFLPGESFFRFSFLLQVVSFLYLE